MQMIEAPFSSLLSATVDNRGRSCPTSTSGIPLIATNCIRNESLYPHFDNVRYVSRDTYETWFRGHPEPGDIIFVNKGTPGRVCLVPDPVDFVIAQDMVAVRANPSTVYPHYLFAALRSIEVQERIEQMHVGTMIPHFKKSDFERLRIPIPAVRRDQEFIGDVYFALSRKIDVNRRMNHTLEATAAALFRSWFVDFDPVVAKAEGRRALGVPTGLNQQMPSCFAPSAEDPVPLGWQVGTVHDLAAFVNGRNFTTGASGTGRMVIRIAEMGGEARGSTVFNDVAASEENIARAGDLLFSWSGSLRVARWHGDESLVNQHIFKVVCSYWPQWFVHHHLDLALPVFQEIAAGKATTMGHIKREHLSQVRVAFPPKPVLEPAGEVIEPLYNRIHSNERENRTLAALRDMLLPQLLSGAIRLRDAERAVGAAV